MKRLTFPQAIAVPLVFALGLLAAGGCKGPGGGPGGSRTAGSKEPIRIGEYGSLTGETATFGTSTRDGIDLKIAEINGAGGVLGRPLEVYVEDDRSQAGDAATAVTRLINEQKVVTVLGEVASTRSLTAAPICQRAGIPMITPASTNDTVTQQGDCIFRICYTDSLQGATVARFAYGTLKSRNAAVLFDKTQDYSQGLAKSFAATFQKLGGKVAVETSFSGDDQDFKAQLTAIQAAGPDSLFVPGYYNKVGLIAKQAREIGITIPLLGGDGWDSPRLWEIGGKALENGYFADHYSVDDKSPLIQDFVKKYQAKYHQVPDAMAALGYDVAGVLADAIKRAGTTDPKPLRDAIAKTAGYQGVTGTISLDANRNAVKPIVMLEVKGGHFKLVQTIQPQ